MAQVQSFTRPVLQQLRGEIDAVLAKFAKEHGLIMELGNIKFSDAEFTAQLKTKIEGKKTLTDEILLGQIRIHGLVQSKNGYELTGYHSRRYAYPFSYTAPDGKRFKCSIDQAKRLFGA